MSIQRKWYSACILVMLVAAIPARQGDSPFIDAESLEYLAKSHGDSARRRGVALNELLAKLSNEDDTTRLREINRFFNQFHYREDKQLWGVDDYWQTPIEFLAQNSGDCEDFVIAKYFALLATGVGEGHLYLTYVKAVKENIAHMVLSYFATPGSIPLILDNYNPRILPANERKDLLPVYSFNAKSLFLSGSAGLGAALPTDKVKNSKWDKLLERAQRKSP